MKKFRRRLLSLSLAFAMVSSLFSPMVFASETFGGEVKNHQIYVFSKQKEIQSVALYLKDELIEKKTYRDGLTFDIDVNGEFQIVGLDSDEKKVETSNIVMNDFDNYEILDNKGNFSFIARENGSIKVRVNGKEDVALNKVGRTFQGSYQAMHNGTFEFEFMNSADEVLYEANFEVQTAVDKGINGEILIANEADLLKLKENPYGDFVLKNDITIKSDILKDVVFKGTLVGNGFTLDGIGERLFYGMEYARLENIVVKSGKLAKNVVQSTILNVGFYMEIHDDQASVALIEKSEGTTIENSFILANIEAKQAAGFVWEGQAKIKNSYVSGYIQAENVYGFGKNVDVEDSYLSASLLGEKRVMFSNGRNANNFFDVKVNDLIDENAIGYSSKDILSGKLDLKNFQQKEGFYPQMLYVDGFQDKAKAFSLLSVKAVESESNLSGLTSRVSVLNSADISWKGKDVQITNEDAMLTRENGEIIAVSEEGLNRFALGVPKAIVGIVAGISTNKATTQISFACEEGSYYQVVAKGSIVNDPKTHQEALGNGWKIVYWSGVLRESSLDWDKEYDVYKSDLKTKTLMGSIQTNQQKIVGSVAISGIYDVGENLTATLKDVQAKKGTMIWESASTMSAGTWKKLKEEIIVAGVSSSTYEVSANEYYQYVRVRFVPDGYVGILSDITSEALKNDIEGVRIVNAKPQQSGDFSIGDKLYATILPAGKDNEVTYEWYQEGIDKSVGSGKNYTIKGNDVNQLLYVVATAKSEGELKGRSQSISTSSVKAIKSETPSANIVVEKIEDTTLSVQMNVDEGLYRYGIATSLDGERAPYDILARAKTTTVITGLQPTTTYYIYVQRVGENGYIDSEWSNDYIEATTDKDHVRGDIVISGTAIYNQKLQATLINGALNQSGDIVWYRLNDDKTRDLNSKTSGNEYSIKAVDIGKRLEAVYVGNGDWAGEISNISNLVEKEEMVIPTANLSAEEPSDTSVKVTMPSNSDGDKYIIGLSNTRQGVPLEQLDGGQVKEVDSGDSYTINNLERDQQYYLFIRYAANALHEKSDWINANDAIEIKTKKKSFVGNIEFAYESASFMKGQTLTAQLKPEDVSFNYKGEWSWTRISADKVTVTEVNNFVMTNNKQGTTYVVPENEETGVTYKVSFKASVGYDGECENTSSEVKEIVREAYPVPNANDIDLEAIDDTSFKVKMTLGEGKYRFWYKEADTSAIDSLVGLFNQVLNDPNDGYSEVEKDVYNNVEVVVDGLKRNKKYIVRVQRVADEKGDASPFAYSSDATIVDDQSVTTKKTAIAGYVSIYGVLRYGEKITAAYHKAEYSSIGSGSDENGSWQWFSGNEKIVGATNKEYTVKLADVGSVLKAVYLMGESESFEGNVELMTSIVLKATSSNPQVKNVSDAFNKTSQKFEVTFDTDLGTNGQKIYYRVQKEGEIAPSFPVNDEALALWKEYSAEVKISEDSDKRLFDVRGNYIIYLIKTESSTLEGSSVVAKNFTIGKKTQLGTIAFSGKTHVGKEITASISNGNNTMGEWHWYYSATDYTQTNPSSWSELSSGFSPKSNSVSSTLLVPDEAKGKYLSAKFVSTSEDVVGTLDSGKTATSVTKTFTEKLAISGKGYAGETLTVKLTGSDRDLTKTGGSTPGPSQLFNSRVVQVQNANGDSMDNITVIKNVTKDSFQVVVPSNYSQNYDEYYFSVVVNNPDIKIYTKEDGSLISGNYFTMDKNERLQFHHGIPINTANDFINFMTGTGSYTNRAASYVITNNINLTSSSKVTATATTFSGVLNGDYHTIVGLKNPLFQIIRGTSSKKAKIHRMIISNGNLNGANMAIIAQKAGYVDVKELLLVDTDIRDSGDTGLLFALASDVAGFNTGENVSLEKIGTAKGSLTQTSNDKSVGGMISQFTSYAQPGSNSAKDVFSVNFTMNISSGSWAGGLFRNAGSTRVKNTYTANNMVDTNAGNVSGIAVNVDPTYGANNFYDKTLMTPKGDGSGDKMTNNVLVGRTTNDMIGTKLKSSFDDGSNGVWVYKDGYYPRLKWTVDKNIEAATLYAATRGAFVPLDTYTTTANLFDGNIYGSVSVPEELQKPGYSYSSSNTNVFTVTSNGVITPKTANGSAATISVTYSDPLTGAKPVATFNFNARKAMSNFTNVSISGSAAIGKTFTANVSPAVSSSYKWYKKLGDNERILINNATSSTYVAKSSDAGYQIQVEVNASSYGTAISAWSNPIQVGAPTLAPTVKNISDSSVTIEGQGGINTQYEYAYATSSSGEKVLMEDKGASVTLNNLARNKAYYVYARVAEGSGYTASDWSVYKSFTTAKTDVTGQIILGSNINNGQQLSMSAPTTNNQVGVWKLERMSSDGITKIGDIVFDDTATITNYTLSDADVGNCVKATFSGSEDYQGDLSVTSRIVLKQKVDAPIAPTFESASDDSLSLRVDSTGKFDIGYATSATAEIMLGKSDQSGNTSLSISNLSRNKAYYVYARYAMNATQENSAWSVAQVMSTGKSSVEGNITISGSLQTGKAMVVTPPSNNGQTGSWKLERVSDSTMTTISPSTYSVDGVTGVLTYQLIAKDANHKIKATFSGNGNFENSVEKISEKIENSKLDTDVNMPTDVTISEAKDDAFNVSANDGSEVYQFGYALKDDAMIHAFDATANAGTAIKINGLTRNTEYDVYVRKAAKLGYDPSDWVKMPSIALTDKSSLTGSVNYLKWDEVNSKWGDAKVGVAEMNSKYKATYVKGKYDDNADDLMSGSWQWYANDQVIEGADADTYTIEPMESEQEIEISARYVAKEDADFKDFRSVSIGTLTKPLFDVPALPSLRALAEDGDVGSKVSITSSEVDDVYYYVQKAVNNQVPTVILQSKANQNLVLEGQWFKAGSEVTITLAPGTDYTVYVSRLEDGGHQCSGVISTRAVKSVKDELDQIIDASIVEADIDASWKVMQLKELRVDVSNTVTNGVWQYYVSESNDESALWKNINLELKETLEEGITAQYAYSKIMLPLKYVGYYVRAIYTGRAEYEGSLQYESSEKAEGKILKGHVEVASGDASEVFVPVNVNYVFAKNTDGTSIKDDENGYWRWYRETAKGSNQYAVINGLDGNPIGAIGMSDSYTPQAADVGLKMYAQYFASEKGVYSGFAISDIIKSVERSPQFKPDALQLLQVNGTNVQVRLPSNYKTDGSSVPEVVLGYRKQGDSGNIIWLNEFKGSSWIKDALETKSKYEIYARFDGTSEFAQSEASDFIVVTTENSNFDEKNLVIEEEDVLESGSTLRAIYKGLGFDEGYFQVSRSDGEVMEAMLSGDTSDNKIEMEYKVRSEDIGSNIIISYIAKNDAIHFAGDIQKASNSVLKPENITSPTTPVLNSVKYSETTLNSSISKDYEYVFNTSSEVIKSDKEWMKFTNEVNEVKVFDSLNKDTTYYLHARLAETQSYRSGEEVVSAATTPWNSSNYEIKYLGVEGAINGDADDPNPIQYSELSEDITLKDASKTGYTFLGWTSKTILDPIKNVKIPKNSEGELIFTANWTKIPYSITYDLKGGVEPLPNNPKQFTIEDDDIVLSAPSRVGHAFKGWTSDTISEPQLNVTIPKGSYDDREYVANWGILKYKIYFDGQEGTSPENLELDFDSVIGDVSPSVRDGYDFGGWFTDKNGQGTKLEPTNKVVAKEVTYYAYWSEATYTIEYELNNGQDADPMNPNPSSYKISDEDIVLKAPVKNRNNFLGWTFAGEDKPQLNVTILKGSYSNKKFIANWDPEKYWITFDTNGGEAIEKLEKGYETSMENLPTPEYLGYKFLGWKNGDAFIANSDTMPANNLTLKAEWQIANYDIKYSGIEGANISANPNQYTINTPTFKLNNPSKTGYTFLGWSKNDDETANLDVSVVKGSTGGLLFKAQWEQLKYVVTYYNEGTEYEKIDEAFYDTYLTAPVSPKKTGYVFGGWFKEETLDNEWDFANDKVLEELSLYAKWDIGKFMVTFDADNELDPVSEKMAYDTVIKTPTQPSKTYYSFSQWNTKKDGTGTNFVAGTSKVPANEITYYAIYIANPFAIIYMMDEGTNATDNPSTYTIQSEDISLKEPTREFYDFEGWSKGDVNNEKVKNPVIVKGTPGPLTFYAHWKKVEYQVSFDSKEGSEVPTKSIPYGDKIIEPSVVKKGHSLLGWYTEDAYTNQWDFMNDKVESSMVLYAKWKTNSYDITFNSQNSESNQVVTRDYDSVIGIPSVPIKKGYTFKGWNTKSDGKGDVLSAETKISDADITYYAIWESVTYTLIYSGLEGCDPITNPNQYTVLDADILLTNPVKKGNNFKGWTLKGDADQTPNLAMKVVSGSTGNKEFIANFEIKTYEITFQTNGGDAIDKITRKYQDLIGVLPTPTKKGYDFVDWYTEDDGGEVVNKDDLVDADALYYAKWKLHEYQISYNVSSDGVNNANNPKSYTIKDNDISILAPTRKYSEFTGWTYEGVDVPNKDVIIRSGSDGDIDFTANWKVQQFDVSFDGNGGKDASTVSLDYGSEMGTLPVSTRDHYVFSGWYTKKNGGEKINKSTLVKGENVTYYAQWSLFDYAIQYILNGGLNGSGNPNSYTIQSKEINLNAPHKAGSIFEGWIWNGQSEPQKAVKIVSGSSGVKIYQAVWKAKQYQVNYQSENNGTVSSSNTVIWEQGNLNKNVPSRNGYRFTGWYYGNTLINAQMSYGGLVGNEDIMAITLVARWVKLPFSASNAGNSSGKAVVNEGVKTPSKTTKKAVNSSHVNVVIEKDGKKEDAIILDQEQLVKSILTKEQLKRMSAGSKFEVKVAVNERVNISEKHKKMVQMRAKDNDINVVTYYDINVLTKENDAAWIKVKQLQDRIELVLQIAKKYQNKGYEFYGIRLHNGKSLILDDLDDKESTLTIQTDQFSTYALGYKEKSDGDNLLLIGGISIVVILILGSSLVLRRKKETGN